MHMNKKLLSSLLAAGVTLLSLIFLLNHRDKTEFHGDETGWVSAGLYYTDLLMGHDFDCEHWRGEGLSAWGGMNPQVGKWVLGIPLRSHFPEYHYKAIYDFGASYKKNEAAGNVPDQEVLHYARGVAAVAGTLCCLALFIFGCRSGHCWGGAVAALLLLGNGIFVSHATRAMTDMMYNLFLICTGLAGLVVLSAQTRKTLLWGCALLGLCAGLASAVKITGILVGGLLLLGLLTYRALVHKTAKNVILSILVYGISGLITVHALNPYYWPNVSIMNGKALAQEFKNGYQHLDEIKAVMETGEDEKMAVLREEYPQITNLSHALMFPIQFIHWKFFMQYLEDMPSASWGDHRFGVLNKTLFMNFGTFPLEVCFLGFGFFVCLGRIRSAWKAGTTSPYALPLLLFFANYLFILLFMSLNWDRYYLPTLVAGRLLVAIGICELIRALYVSLSGRAADSREGARKS